MLRWRGVNVWGVNRLCFNDVTASADDSGVVQVLSFTETDGLETVHVTCCGACGSVCGGEQQRNQTEKKLLRL